jgi:hypothetical protein
VTLRSQARCQAENRSLYYQYRRPVRNLLCPALPWITTFQYGGTIPFSMFQDHDKDTYNIHCPDSVNMVIARMPRTFHKVWDDSELQRVMKEAMKEMDKKSCAAFPQPAARTR